MTLVASYVDKPETGYLMNSPLLFEMLQDLQQAGYYQLLDVMPATPGLLEAFSDQHCKLFLPGCMPELIRMRTSEDDTAQKLQRALRQALGLDGIHNTRLDMLLLWDLPNYLSKPVLSGLIEYLLAHTHHRARLHCYIYTRQLMPASPGVYQFVTGEKIWVEEQSAQTLPSPTYYQEALHKLLAPFVVERSILLSNGLQEYVLRK